MKRFLDIALVTFFAIYPFVIYAGLNRWSPRTIASVVLALLILRMLFLFRLSPSRWKSFIPLFVAGLTCTGISVALQSTQALLLMPVAINAVLLSTFAYTLRQGPSMIARFAALREKNMTAEIHSYCRKVTWIWCGFFLFNGSVSAATVFLTSREYWTLYNGLISYILIGTLFLIEFIVRKKVQRQNETRVQNTQHHES